MPFLCTMDNFISILYIIRLCTDTSLGNPNSLQGDMYTDSHSYCTDSFLRYPCGFKHILFMTKHDKGLGRAQNLCLVLAIPFFSIFVQFIYLYLNS